MRRMTLALILVACFTAQTFAVGTATWTQVTPFNNLQVDVYSVAWTSSSGAVSGNTYTVRPGRLVQVEFIPGSGGTQPTDLYDVTIVDANSVDVLAGAGVDRSNSTGSYLIPVAPVLVTTNNVLDVVVANAGNSKTGTVVLWVARD